MMLLIMVMLVNDDNIHDDSDKKVGNVASINGRM